MPTKEILIVGEETTVISESHDGPHGAVFEDDGETGYFYALDLREDQKIVDAVHIYNVAAVADRNLPSEVEILWSAEGTKAMLRINQYPHAIFDFNSRLGACRTAFPPPGTQGPEAWSRPTLDEAILSGFTPSTDAQ